MSHTPTPWDSRRVPIGLYYVLFSTECGSAIGHIGTAEDAEFIVRACNSFEALLAACKQALQTLEVAIEAACDDKETAAGALREHHVLVQVRAAIAAAEGK